eukprot:COSAG06_NODE_1298_length_9953_cov_150.245281_8_plen_123_part_00
MIASVQKPCWATRSGLAALAALAGRASGAAADRLRPLSLALAADWLPLAMASGGGDSMRQRKPRTTGYERVPTDPVLDEPTTTMLGVELTEDEAIMCVISRPRLCSAAHSRPCAAKTAGAAR